MRWMDEKTLNQNFNWSLQWVWTVKAKQFRPDFVCIRLWRRETTSASRLLLERFTTYHPVQWCSHCRWILAFIWDTCIKRLWKSHSSTWKSLNGCYSYCPLHQGQIKPQRCVLRFEYSEAWQCHNIFGENVFVELRKDDVTPPVNH